MARGRMINQTIAEDLEFNEMSMEAQLMYVRAIPFLDRDGLINGHPSILFGKIAPLMPTMLPMMPAIINEWLTAGLVFRYMDGKTAVLYFKGFTQNQVGLRYDREPDSQFAPPPGFKRSKSGLTKLSGESPTMPPSPDDNDDQNGGDVDRGTDPRKPDSNCGVMPEECRKNAGSYPPEEKRREENKREEKSAGGVVVSGSVLPTVTAADVHTLWQNNMPGSMSPIIADELDDLISTYNPVEVDTAIRLAVSAGKRNIRYVNGILRKRAAGEDKPQPTQVAKQPIGVSGNLGFSLASI